GTQVVPAVVWNAAGWLEQEESPIRIGKRYSSAKAVADDGNMVLIRRVAKHRELEPALTVLACVTRPRVAAGLGQNRHDLCAEIDGRLGRHTRYFHGKLASDSGVNHAYRSLAVSNAEQLTRGADCHNADL